MELSLEQQFQKRRFMDCVQQMSETQLLDNLKDAHNLLKQKNHVLQTLIENGEISFIESNDPSYKFAQIMTHREFENYNREQLAETLLGTLECLMYTDNQLSSFFKGVKINA